MLRYDNVWFMLRVYFTYRIRDGEMETLRGSLWFSLSFYLLTFFMLLIGENNHFEIFLIVFGYFVLKLLMMGAFYMLVSTTQKRFKHEKLDESLLEPIALWVHAFIKNNYERAFLVKESTFNWMFALVFAVASYQMGFLFFSIVFCLASIYIMLTTTKMENDITNVIKEAKEVNHPPNR